MTNELLCFLPFCACFAVIGDCNKKLPSYEHCPRKFLYNYKTRNFCFLSFNFAKRTKLLSISLKFSKIKKPRVLRYKCDYIFLHLCTKQHVRPALRFCYSFNKVIDTGWFLNSGHAWAPVCNVCWRWPDGPRKGYRMPGAVGGEFCCVLRSLITDIGLGLTEKQGE